MTLVGRAQKLACAVLLLAIASVAGAADHRGGTRALYKTEVNSEDNSASK